MTTRARDKIAAGLERRSRSLAARRSLREYTSRKRLTSRRFEEKAGMSQETFAHF